MKLKISFYLKSGIKSQIPVIALVSYGYKEYDVSTSKFVYKPLRYYTGFRMEAKDWDKETNLPKQKTMQSELIQLEKRITEIYNFLRMQQTQFSTEEFKRELDIKIKGKETHDINRIRIVDFIDNDILTSNELHIKTKYNYITTKRIIEDFEEKIKKPFYSSDVNEHTFKLFVSAIRNRENITKQNTVWSVIKNFVSVLNKIGRKYKIEVFKPSKELEKKDIIKPLTEDKVYLTFEQIQTILDYQPKEEHLKNVKLIFITLLFTGCRYSDVFKIKPEFHFEKNGINFYYAHIITTKGGGKEAIIPILKPLMDAIDANGGKTASPVNENLFNVQIKILIKKVGFTQAQRLTFTNEQGVKQFVTKPFHEFVSSHIGRRSFITNLIDFIPLPMLCKITTHELKDSSVIFRYNKRTLLENAYHFMRHLNRVRTDFEEDFTLDLVA